MHKRKLYMAQIDRFLNKPVIKVITGIRRSGKSTLLKLLHQKLREQEVPEADIVYVNMDLLEFERITDYKALHRHVESHFTGSRTKRRYLLVDEVQEIHHWEKCIESSFSENRYDIYITGSNAHMLSSELATRLSGRYVEIPVYCLGFEEYLQFMGTTKEDQDQQFQNFLRYGGFPALPHFDMDEEVVYQYISSLYNTILLKDIVKRHRLRNIPLLENITRYAFDNIGNLFSSKKVADYLKSQRMSLGVETVQNYLSHLCATYALHKVRRYDVKGKRILELHEKYYVGDLGLRHAILGYRAGDIGGMLENVVFLELRRRGYQVHIGKLGDLEIDFIASRGDETLYIQTAYLLASQETIDRELTPLLQVKDNYPKFVVTMDRIGGGDIKGIKRVHLIDFLLSENW